MYVICNSDDTKETVQVLRILDRGLIKCIMSVVPDFTFVLIMIQWNMFVPLLMPSDLGVVCHVGACPVRLPVQALIFRWKASWLLEPPPLLPCGIHELVVFLVTTRQGNGRGSRARSSMSEAVLGGRPWWRFTIFKQPSIMFTWPVSCGRFSVVFGTWLYCVCSRCATKGTSDRRTATVLAQRRETTGQSSGGLLRTRRRVCFCSYVFTKQNWLLFSA